MKYLSVLLLVVLSYGLYSQDSQELVTDRPDQTESSVVVPHKTIQIETGALYEFDARYGADDKNWVYNTTLLRYGLLKNFELRLGISYSNFRSENYLYDYVYEVNDLSPLYTGCKIQITEEKGAWPEMAFLGGFSFPFTLINTEINYYTAPGMRFAFSHTLSDVFSFGYNLGAEWDGRHIQPEYFYSVVLGMGIQEKLGTFIEFYGAIPEDGESAHLIDGGFTNLIGPNLQLDISGGLGLNDEALDYFISFGFSLRLPK
jgi:hypothetical protein